MKLTMKRIFGISNIRVNGLIVMKMNIKYAFDGSGSHAIFNQLNNVVTNNINE